MGRLTKQGIDYFPKWNPQRLTWSKIHNLDPKVAMKALRNSSSGFVHRQDVRDTIMKNVQGSV